MAKKLTPANRLLFETTLNAAGENIGLSVALRDEPKMKGTSPTATPLPATSSLILKQVL
jgi:hypothetical protein